MAAAMAYQIPRADDGPSGLAQTGYPRGLSINGLDFSDTRYPAVAFSSVSDRRPGTAPTAPSDLSSWDGTEDTQRRAESRRRVIGEREGNARGEAQMQLINGFVEDQQQQLQRSRLEAVVQYALPPDTTRRVVERRDLEGNEDGLRSAKSDRPLLSESPREESITASQHLSPAGPREMPVARGPSPSSNPRYSTSPTPGAGVGAGSSNRDSSYNPLVPASASPSFNPGASLGIPVPISPKPRAYAQQPTYVTPSAPPNPINPIYMPNPPPQEEVCVECAMRDQDMADVDVTSPGVWDRESDVQYEELLRREQEEGTSEGISSESHRSNRPRARGGKLTEANLKVWLTIVSSWGLILTSVANIYFAESSRTAS